MTRFQTITEKHQGVTIYVLRDLQTGACARIAPALGGNCLELKLPAAPGAEPMAVIDDLKFLSQVKEQPSRYGIPVLFPWPSGIPGGIFKFRDRTYHLNEEGVTRTAHHGFVNRASWKVLRSDCDNTGAWLTCEIASKDCGEAGARFPFPFTLQITWRLTPERFIMQMEARNTGSEPMPAGLGLHPYFSIPFGPKGSRQECRLAATVVRQWDLDKTVGVKADGSAPDQVFLPDMEFDPTTANGKPLGTVKFNHVFEASFDVAKETSATVVDPANDLELTVTASRDFGTWVIYTPPDRDAISLEPWTLTPNGFNLAAAGVENTGMITIQPGNSWQGEVAIHLD